MADIGDEELKVFGSGLVATDFRPMEARTTTSLFWNAVFGTGDSTGQTRGGLPPTPAEPSNFFLVKKRLKQGVAADAAAPPPVGVPGDWPSLSFPFVPEGEDSPLATDWGFNPFDPKAWTSPIKSRIRAAVSMSCLLLKSQASKPVPILSSRRRGSAGPVPPLVPNALVTMCANTFAVDPFNGQPFSLSTMLDSGYACIRQTPIGCGSGGSGGGGGGTVTTPTGAGAASVPPLCEEAMFTHASPEGEEPMALLWTPRDRDIMKRATCPGRTSMGNCVACLGLCQLMVARALLPDTMSDDDVYRSIANTFLLPENEGEEEEESKVIQDSFLEFMNLKLAPGMQIPRADVVLYSVVKKADVLWGEFMEACPYYRMAMRTAVVQAAVFWAYAKGLAPFRAGAVPRGMLPVVQTELACTEKLTCSINWPRVEDGNPSVQAYFRMWFSGVAPWACSMTTSSALAFITATNTISVFDQIFIAKAEDSFPPVAAWWNPGLMKFMGKPGSGTSGAGAGAGSGSGSAGAGSGSGSGLSSESTDSHDAMALVHAFGWQGVSAGRRSIAANVKIVPLKGFVWEDTTPWVLVLLGCHLVAPDEIVRLGDDRRTRVTQRQLVYSYFAPDEDAKGPGPGPGPGPEPEPEATSKSKKRRRCTEASQDCYVPQCHNPYHRQITEAGLRALLKALWTRGQAGFLSGPVTSEPLPSLTLDGHQDEALLKATSEVLSGGGEDTQAALGALLAVVNRLCQKHIHSPKTAPCVDDAKLARKCLHFLWGTRLPPSPPCVE